MGTTDGRSATDKVDRHANTKPAPKGKGQTAAEGRDSVGKIAAAKCRESPESTYSSVTKDRLSIVPPALPAPSNRRTVRVTGPYFGRPSALSFLGYLFNNHRSSIVPNTIHGAVSTVRGRKLPDSARGTRVAPMDVQPLGLAPRPCRQSHRPLGIC